MCCLKVGSAIKPLGRRLLRYFASRYGIVQRKNLWLK
jgi:hypothetical protein